MKTATIIALTAALTCVAAPAAAELTQSPSYVRVVFMEDPAREATVSWVTGAEGSGQKLMLDTEPGGGADGTYDLSWEQVETGPLGGDADPWFHHAVILAYASCKFLIEAFPISPKRHQRIELN